MKKLLSNKYFLILLAITTAVLIAVAFKTATKNTDTVAENGISNAFSHIQSGLKYGINRVKNFFVYFGDIQEITKEKDKLQRENEKLKSDLRDLSEYKTENERLRNMLELKNKEKNYEYIGGNVIAMDSNNWYKSFTIDIGSKDGVRLYAPVVTDKGLVGSVTSVYKQSAKVTALIDSSSSVGAMMFRTKEIALVEGDNELSADGLCKMTYISKNQEIISGDIVTTSGLGGMFPKGIVIGKVREVKTDVKGISHYAVIEPAVDFKRINEVFVIK